MLQNIHPVVLVAFMVATGQLDPTRIGATSNSMPAFDDSTCPQDNGDLCVSVKFSNSIEDLMILTQVSGTHIYEGYLRDDKDVSAVLIDTPLTNKRVIAFNSENVPNCSFFDVDITNNKVKCLRATFNDQNRTNSFLGKTESRPTKPSRDGDIIHLGDDYPEGIDIKVLFYFDSQFHNDFDGEDGKSAEEHMMEAMSVVKNAYKDKSMKTEIGTHVNIIAEKKLYEGSFQEMGQNGVISFYDSSNDQDKHHAFAFISSPGAWGVAGFRTICRKGWSWSFNNAYGPNQCNTFDPPEPVECTPTHRVVLTAETIAHELGHNLGMDHDFDQEIYESTNKYVYRKYKGKECRGLMDYIDDGVGWSQCSMMDFSRYITSGGTQKSCIEGISPTNNGQSPTSPATDRPAPSCDEGQTQCKSGECIPDEYICDGIPWDCEDGSDEKNLFCPDQSPTNPATDRPSSSCLEDETQCRNGECIPNNMEQILCDGIRHCEDGSDEGFCPDPSCQWDEGLCKSGECVPFEWACDRYQDCEDGSDESEPFCPDDFQY